MRSNLHSSCKMGHVKDRVNKIDGQGLKSGSVGSTACWKLWAYHDVK